MKHYADIHTTPPRKKLRLDTTELSKARKCALGFIEKEAKNGEVYAQAMLADHLYKSAKVSGEVDMKKVIDLYEKASDAGDAISGHNLGVLCWGGVPNVLKEDKRRALDLFIRGGMKGHNLSLYKAGLAMENGFKDFKPQPDTAVIMYQAAAEGGHLEAQYRLGVLCIEGTCVLIDKEKARWALRTAALRGHTKAAKFLREVKLKDKATEPPQAGMIRSIARRVEGGGNKCRRNILVEIEGVKDSGELVHHEGMPTYALEILAETAMDKSSLQDSSL